MKGSIIKNNIKSVNLLKILVVKINFFFKISYPKNSIKKTVETSSKLLDKLMFELFNNNKREIENPI